MVNHFDIFGDFGNDTESFLDSFDNESDARSFARVRAGDPDCDYQAISVPVSYTHLTLPTNREV